MVGLQNLDLRIGVQVPASQPSTWRRFALRQQLQSQIYQSPADFGELDAALASIAFVRLPGMEAPLGYVNHRRLTVFLGVLQYPRK